MWVGFEKGRSGQGQQAQKPFAFNLMYRMNLVEQIGSGILRINNALSEYRMLPAEIESDNDWCCMIFKRAESARKEIKTNDLDDCPVSRETEMLLNELLNADLNQKPLI